MNLRTSRSDTPSTLATSANALRAWKVEKPPTTAQWSRPYFSKMSLHHVVFAVVGKINVNVRQFVQRHAFLVQEAAEIKIKADRAHAADAKAIADQAVRRAAARDPVDAAAPAFLQKIPGDEKVFLVTNFVDDAQFLHDLAAELPGAGAVAVRADPRSTSRRRKSLGGEPSGGVKAGNCGLPKGSSKLHRSAISMRVPEPIGMVLAGSGHLRRRAEVQPSAGSLFRVFLPQQRQRADALHDVVFLPVVGGGIVNRRTRDCREILGKLSSRDQTIEPSTEHFRQPFVRADGDQAVGDAVEFSKPVRPPLLARRRKPPRHSGPFVQRAGKAGGRGWHTRARSRRRGARAFPRRTIQRRGSV